MSGRPVLLAVGIVLAGVGLAMTVDPGPARAFPLPRMTLAMVGAGTLFAAVLLVERRRRVDHERAETGEPETLPELPAPGDGFREDLRHAASLRGAGTQEAVRERLRAATVAVIRRRQDCSPSEARRLVDTGEWTDDEFAAVFLGDDLTDGPRIPMDAWLRIESPFTYRARRTVRAIVDLAGMEVEP